MKRIEQAHLPFAARSDTGAVRRNNEDRYAVAAFEMEHDGAPVLLAVLCDGVGGNRAGEVAAELAVEEISTAAAAANGRDPVDTLRAAIMDASQKIYTQAQANVNQMGMGATTACAWIVQRQLYTATVGDSRIYLMRDDGIQQISTDHTWIQEALDHGLLTPEMALNHPNAHVIRRFLGSPKPPEVDFRLRLRPNLNDEQSQNQQGTALRPGDIVLLCSDGLTDLVPPGDILTTCSGVPLAAAVDALIELACSRGGHDNITIIAIGVPAEPPAAGPKPRDRRWGCWLLGALLAIVLSLGIVALSWWALTDRPTPTPPPPVIEAATPTLLPPVELVSPTPTTAVMPTILPRPGTPTPPAATLPSPGQSGATLTPWPTNTP
ncbi:MAG TPA: protein phosphatase 2C domain-containing protein [Anaerolineaceae bacterium]|nr:protein phosphatase 2C domain-containing protein [Anaerolineaceae bacterium]